MTGTTPEPSDETPRQQEPFTALTDLFSSAQPPSVEADPVAVRYLVTPPSFASTPASTPAPPPTGTGSTGTDREPTVTTGTTQRPRRHDHFLGHRSPAQRSPVQRGQSAPRRPRRNPAIALPLVALLALVSAFFAWQSAEPWWLTVGHGHAGTATETRCDPLDGSVAGAQADPSATYSCVVFTAHGDAFEVTDVTLRGADPAAGAPVAAWMVAPDRDRAYVADPVDLYLRWVLGLLMVLACGGAIAWVTGARRLDDRRARRRAVLWSFAGPLALTAGFLVAAI